MIRIGIILGCLLLSFGCSKQQFSRDEPGGGAVLKGDSIVMNLSTGFADMFTPSATKAAMTDMGENMIRRIDVLVFKITPTDTVYHYSVRAGNIVTSEGNVWFNATFNREAEGEKFKLVLCANLADDAIQNASLVVGARRDSTLARIGYTPESGWTLGQAFIPMWGEYDTAAELIEGAKPSDFGACNLMRAMAKVTITNNDPKFDLEGARVYGMPDRARIAPADSCLVGGKVVQPTLFKESGILNVGWMTAKDQKVLNGLYVSEWKAPKTSVQGAGVRVIVKGKYNGAAVSSYYRFDLVSAGDKPAMMDVLRNQVYNFTITDLKHIGRTTEAEAAEMLPENGIGVVVWDNDTLNCLYSDGVYTIAMQDTIKIPYYTNATLDSCFKYSTDYPGSYLYSPSDSWLTITTTKPSPVRFKWTENVSGQPREGKLYVDAGLRLRGIQHIYQEPAIYTVTPTLSKVPYYATTNNKASYTTDYVGKVKRLVANSWPAWVSNVTYDSAKNVVTYSVAESFETTSRAGTITVTIGHKDVKLPIEQAAAIYTASMPAYSAFAYRKPGSQTRSYTTDYLGARTTISSSSSNYTVSINPNSKVISVAPSQNIDDYNHSATLTVTIGRLTYTIPVSQPPAPYPICGGYQVTKTQSTSRMILRFTRYYCDDLVEDGYSDWSVPEHSVLWSFWNNGKTVYGGGEQLLPRVYWSTTFNKDPGGYWYFDYANGNVGVAPMEDENFVRCVRGSKESGWD